MTKKDFVALADALKGQNLNILQLQAITDFSASRNPRFNRVRWLDYLAGNCGFYFGKIKTKVH